MGAITDIRETHGLSPWRASLLPAHFRNAMFHVEMGSRENGRRVVVHEFPKKDLPYSEDMGRSAIMFNVRGYCIVYPRDTELDLYQRDYRIPRDLLMDALETGGPGVLQLPTLRPMTVACMRYRLTEEERFGGYCVFDMQFSEQGQSPFDPLPTASDQDLLQQSIALANRVLQLMSGQP